MTTENFCFYLQNGLIQISQTGGHWYSDTSYPFSFPSSNVGSVITNGREHRSCLGRVFNSKLSHNATLDSQCMVCMQPLLKLKTRPMARVFVFGKPFQPGLMLVGTQEWST
jgi:hypothetical protein